MSPTPAATRPAFARWLGATNEVTATFLSAGSVTDLISLAGGLPPPEAYPAEEIAEIARQAMLSDPQGALGYGPVAGLTDLREAIAKRFASPDLRITGENVLITTGGMSGLDLIGKVLLEPGDHIAAQFPTYLGALDAWRPRTPTYRNMAAEAADFDAVAAFTGAQFAYAVPNFSNPTGRLVGLAERQVLVDSALATGVWLVEDDPYGMLQFDGEPLPRLIDLAARARPGGAYDGPVVYMGSLSKAIAPGLRIGWVIAAPEMVDALTTAKQGSDMCTSALTQSIALQMMETGLAERIRPRLIDLYRRRRDALCAAMGEYLSEWFAWEVPAGGMFVWATAKDPALDTNALLPHALAAGVSVAPSSVFDAADRYRRAIRINFTLNDEARLAEGMRRLAQAVKAMRTRAG